ncbi:MAG: glycerol-3-phosphate O-acyltransferase/dihydroxyacetone phosphate acyltransferase, partial [Mariniblastus sp.]
MNKVEPSLVGSLARRVARRLVKIYYPHIKLTGAALIPEAGPVLFCGNHPNSLVDPLVIGIASGRPVRFMAKAPLFKTPVLGPIMYGLGMIPTYRGSDDSKQVRRNLESLDSSIQFLVEGHAVGIFPEGKSHDAVQVEMVRSGVARIAVQVVERGASE